MNITPFTSSTPFTSRYDSDHIQSVLGLTFNGILKDIDNTAHKEYINIVNKTNDYETIKDTFLVYIKGHTIDDLILEEITTLFIKNESNQTLSNLEFKNKLNKRNAIPTIKIAKTIDALNVDATTKDNVKDFLKKNTKEDGKINVDALKKKSFLWRKRSKDYGKTAHCAVPTTTTMNSLLIQHSHPHM